MKKILLLITLLFLMTNCNVSELNNLDNSTSKISMKINNTNFSEMMVDNSSTHQSEHSLKWTKYNNGNGTYNYSIYGYIHENGFVVSFSKSIGLSLGTIVQNGQIININTPGFSFDILGTGLDTSEYRYTTGENYTGISSGQIKITYFDGVTMSGEFNFLGITKYVEYPQSGVDYTNNTVVGTFTSIEKQN